MKAFSAFEPMQAGVPGGVCSLQRSTQRNSEVERSGGTLKQVALAGEGVQPVGQAVAAAGRKRMAVEVSTRAPVRILHQDRACAQFSCCSMRVAELGFDREEDTVNHWTSEE